ncbi:MAG: RIP metalloprotease RseP, partial [Paracoccaceae bacterium]
LTVKGPHPFPPIVGSVQPLSAAMDAGFAVGDVVLEMDGVAVSTFNEMPAMVEASGGKPMLLKIWRDGTTFDTTLSPKRVDIPADAGGFETRWLLGLTNDTLFELETRSSGPFEAVWLAAKRTWNTITMNLSFLWNIVVGNVSSCGVSGPIGIAKVSGAMASQGATSFVLLIAMLSTSVGLMNLFPIPVLDGGHLVFHAWEAVTGKPPTDFALRILMAFGLTILLSLMVFALFNDIFCP